MEDYKKNQLMFIVVTLALLLIPIKWTVCRQVAFNAVDESGKPLEGINIIQEWGRTAFSFGYTINGADEKEIKITDKNGSAVFSEKSYYFMLWRIIQVEIFGLIEANVNFSEDSFSNFSINGIYINIEESSKRKTPDKLVISECEDRNKYICQYECMNNICRLKKTPIPTDEEFREKDPWLRGMRGAGMGR